jgi:hypothetical protein
MCCHRGGEHDCIAGILEKILGTQCVRVKVAAMYLSASSRHVGRENKCELQIRFQIFYLFGVILGDVCDGNSKGSRHMG